MVYESEISIYKDGALKRKFSSIQTQFDVTLGKISAIISESEIEEYLNGHTTMNSKLSSVVQDVDGVHTQVSSMQTNYDGQFTTVNSHLTQLDTSISGITASVSSVQDDVDGLGDRVSAAELKITDSAIISTVTETVGGKTALNSVIDQRADSIRLKADKISWSSTYSSMAEDGSLTVQSLTARNYIYVNGDKRTYFRLPLYPLQNSLESQETYFEISNGGMVVKTYSAESKPGTASVEYVTTTFSNSSSLSSRTKAIQISCSANESILEIGAFGFNSELKNGTKRYYTRFDWQGCSFEFYPSSSTEGHVRSTYSYDSCRIEGDIYVTGTKNRIVSTDDYSDRLLYCYETPSPLFGDIGEGEIGEDGKCYVWLDPVFSQTIRTSNYQVSLQSYSPSLTYVMERTGSYFVVGGEPGAKFGWEIKAKQADFAERRLDRFEEQREDDSVNYGLLASNHINELMEGRYAE